MRIVSGLLFIVSRGRAHARRNVIGLNLNVIVPEHVKPGQKLPVVAVRTRPGLSKALRLNDSGRILVHLLQ